MYKFIVFFSSSPIESVHWFYSEPPTYVPVWLCVMIWQVLILVNYLPEMICTLGSLNVVTVQINMHFK